MALMISGNAKPDTNVRQRNRFLDDPERVKKDLEHERRITRLQQVREKSNSMARQIRQEVAAEKTRQVQKLESIKQKELDVWREHVMAKKHQDYRTSVFQVGAAHRAALVEVEKTEQQKQQRIEKMKKCRRLAANRASKHTPANVVRATGGRDLNVEGRATAGTQTPLQGETDGKENRLNNNRKGKSSHCPGTSKSKHTRGHGNANSQHEICDEFVALSDSSCDDDDIEQRPVSGPNSRKLQKTPPIIMDVDIESEDSLEICTRDGIEINDRHIQTNRKFSRVVHPSPPSSPVRQQGAVAVDAVASRPRFTQISELVRRSTQVIENAPERRQHQKEEQPINPPSSPTRSTKSIPQAQAVSPKRSPNKETARASPKRAETQKRSSLRNVGKQVAPAKVIDAGIKRSTNLPQPVATVEAQPTGVPPMEQVRMQQQMPLQDQHMQLPPVTQQQTHLQQMPMQPLPPNAPQAMQPHALYAAPIMPGYPAPMLPYSIQTYPMQPMQQYPQQQSTYAAPQQPIQAASSSTGVVAPPSTRATHSSVSTTTTYVVRQKQGSGAETNTTGRVQFYDHNNKYYRNYKAPAQAVQVHLPDATHLNAMDHARLETQLNQLREQELDKLRKVTEQRGQKALQREQVRRDCAELTEKLEALTQQQPQLLPSDSNFVPSHRFADLASRREQKLNEAMEQMLLRPAIVTCPEVGRSRLNSPKKSCGHSKSSAAHAINVGDPPEAKADDAVSSASCCSLLLDYVDDQSKQLRTELKGMHSKSAKSIKLKSLLQRIDKIRAQLLAELKAGDMTGDNAQKVIDSIRKERANINSDMARNLDEREMELQKKEEILEQRLRQLYKQQQKLEGQKERKKQGDNNNEIIIKVKSDGTVKQYIPKAKSQSNPHPKASDEATTSSSAGGNAASAERQQVVVELTQHQNVLNHRQNSMDSNSTAYRDLPPVNYENIKATTASNTIQAQPEPLHPIVAHYVQRLLAMSQTTIEQLGVSSSEVPTPTDSIINQPHNRSSAAAIDENLIDNQRVERVQAFIQDNHSFINELESTLIVQQKEHEQQQKEQQMLDKESSDRAFDQIWMNRFANNKKQQQEQQQQQKHSQPQQQPQAQQQQSQQQTRQPIQQQQSQREPERSSISHRGSPGQTRRSVTIAPETESTRNTARSLGNQKPNQVAISEATTTTTTSRVMETQVISSNQINKSENTSEKSSTRHMERYEMLTEKCIQRISDLTELINKVRGEKQRLVEVTLTSASEGDRHSTEYFDLPPMQGLQQQREERGVRTLSEGSDATQSNSEALPLQKHKPTGASLDSGISVSRPMTAMGLELPDAEPTSLGSSNQGGTHRRGKVPPATIRRYSPQLAAEELAHELSTITEVDTPAQSHIVPVTTISAPIPFPTFEQYARELQLDVSQMNADQSVRMQHEFHELIQCIKQDIPRLDYRQFPSITAYLYESTATLTRVPMDRPQAEQPSMTAGELMEQMRLNNVSIREFPTRRDYLQQLLEREPPDQRDLIDSASLESSDSFNVEAELRQRRLLKSSFRRGPPVDLLEIDVASSTRRESIPQNASTNIPNESHIEPLSRSHVEQPQGMQRPISMRQRQRQAKQPGSHISSSSSEPERQSRSPGGASIEAPQEVSQIGRSLNLREFLTKELLKHRNQRVESGSEGTDDSLKGHFLRSVIDSLSRSESPHTPGLGHGTNATNDRQKTSTPVGSLLTGQDKSGSLHSSDSQLFSMDSRISAVHYPDGTPPIPYERQNLSTDRGSTGRNSKLNRMPTNSSRK
ncbi:uncharacterized protein LOC117790353 [Drosophila innubila]|uniref:uncharacterized protein LOC117790353 n=1 Tax=Drosophila innubila TaxID=198719 RepID=UPI00148C2044|nr:uncharacterized protein LOC117790353 [Drosophila innubila]